MSCVAVTKEEFIERARKVHGDAYIYDRVVMRGMRNKVEIVCPEHGSFWQRPGDHVRGQGCRECAKAKRAATNLREYGSVVPMGNAKCQAKARATSLKHFGTEHPMQSDAGKKLFTDAMEREHGVKWALEPGEIREKRDATMVERHGDTVPIRCEDIREKIQQTSREQYDADWYIASDAVQAKINETCQAEFGVDWPAQSPEIRERMRQGRVEKLGVEHALQSDEIKAQMVERSRENWGHDWPCQSADVKESIRQSVREKYGVDWPSQTVDAKRHFVETSRARYGVDHPMQDEVIKQRAFETRRRKGTLSSSAVEDDLYRLLCEMFGKADVARQYRDERYPFACDFYIKSRDLFIELNASWTHGGHWFDPAAEADQAKLREWQRKADAGSDYYAAAIETWTVRDYRKHQIVWRNGINFIAFWDNDLADAKRWLASFQDEEMI